MSDKKKFHIFPYHLDKTLFTTILVLIVFSSLMILSAEMGRQAGELSIISRALIRQIVFTIVGLIAFAICTKFDYHKIPMKLYWTLYYVFLILLISTRLFASANGAYAWIRIGDITIQPSEFAKVFMIIFFAKIFENDHKEYNELFLKRFMLASFVMFIIIWRVERDFGSAFVLLSISYFLCFIPPYKELDKIRYILFIVLIVGFIAIGILMSPIGTALLTNFSSDYRIARFLASANPFAYQYDSGYHLILGLSSFATGKWFGLGYTNSIHKYMNFPNPSTDFILPVIVEELGIVLGLLPIIVAYAIILFKLIRYSLKFNKLCSKIILLGTFLYISIHFVLNVGGVSGFIPLTGVPLLMVSSGGSSLIACLCALGFCENEIIENKK